MLRPELDSCGCAMGARFIAVAAILATAWYLWHWAASDLSLGAAIGWILGWTFVAGGLGKTTGILLWRRRAGRRLVNR
jgi:hypothetical protein